MSTKAERAAAAQADIKNDPNAPQGANTPVTAETKPTKATKLPKGELFVVKDTVSGHIYSDPLTKAKADEKLTLVEAKEKREHSAEAQHNFVLVPFNSDEN